MKHKLLLTLIPVLLLASCSTISSSDIDSNESTIVSDSTSIYSPDDTRTSDNPSSDKESISSSDDASSGSDDTTSATKTDKISIKTLGNLYINGYRTIYALLDESLKSKDIVWSSLNESVVKVSTSNDNSLEGMLIAISEGNATIRATTSDGLYYNDYDLTVFGKSSGTIMSKELYSTISAGVEFNLKEDYLNYDSKLESSISSTYTVKTIYEENQDAVSDLYSNLTDAYSIVVTDSNNKSQSLSYVRNSTDLAKEYININNQVKKESVYDDDGNRTKYDNSIFINFLGDEDYFTNEDFISYDNGLTYHFVGGYMSSAYLATSLLYESNISPDDLWFSVTEGKVTGFDFRIDPITDDEDLYSGYRYGMSVTGSISNQGTAAIDHLQPYAHESYHDVIDTALTNTKASKNYTVNYDVNFGTSVGTNHYQYKFDESTVDVVITSGNSIASHTGVRKSDSGYYTYSYDDTTKVLTKEKEYTTAFDDPENGINRYPTFDFASEIFADINNQGYYETRGGNGKNGQIVGVSAYLPSLYGNWSSQGKLTIKDNYISTLSSDINLVDNSTTITLNYSDYSTTKIDIDFTTSQEKEEPSSWEEANETLYKDLKEYGLDTIIPYQYSKVGWRDSAGWNREPYNAGHQNRNIETYAFETSDDRDSFITSYKGLLIKEGWTLTTTNDYWSTYSSRVLYTKTINDKVYELSVGPEINWKSEETNTVHINVYADGLND